MALTKTTSIDIIDEWAAIAAATLREGAAEDVSGSYESLLYIEVALTHADAQSGSSVIIEISYADDDWMKLAEFSITAETPATTQTAEDPTSAEDTTVTLDDAGTGDFDVVGRKWFIIDGTVANSESVRTKSEAGDVVTLCQDTMREHAVNSNCWDRVDEFCQTIPFAAAYVRVLVNNMDATAILHSTTRISKVTAMS